MMKFYFACAIFLALLFTVKGKGNTTNSTTPSKLPSSSVVVIISDSNLVSPSVSSFSLASSTLVINASSTLVINASSTFLPIPGNTSAINPNSTMYPNMTSNVPTNNTVNPNMSSPVHQNSSTPVSSNVTPSPSHSMTPVTPTKSAGKDHKDYDKMKKRMWIAAAFAIIFAITTVILGYFVYRQRRINRELQGDPAASRLL